MKAKVNILAKLHPYIFFSLQVDSMLESWIWHPCSYQCCGWVRVLQTDARLVSSPDPLHQALSKIPFFPLQFFPKGRGAEDLGTRLMPHHISFVPRACCRRKVSNLVFFVWESGYARLGGKWPRDMAKTMPCILLHYHKSAAWIL